HTRWPRDWSSDVCSSDLLGRRSIRADENVPCPWLVCIVHFSAPRTGHFVPELQIQTAYDGMYRVRNHRLAAGNPVADAGVKRVQVVDRVSALGIHDRLV